MFPWADFQHYLVIQGCSQGLLQWPWTKWPQTSEFVLLFCCLWGLLLLISLCLPFSCPFSFQCVPAHLLWTWKIKKLGLSVRLLVRLLSQRPVVSSATTPPGQCETQVLNVCWLSSPRVLSLQHHQSCPPPPSLCPRSSLHRGKEEWRACSFFLRMWPRSEVTSTHIPLART